ncbi:MAG: MATE family efflux transporter [Spirochaetaceae bacterium]|jgi:putative MATE family efflux protein|nr:MATE family efflux transporter [Spirochaetaceae bacterium]
MKYTGTQLMESAPVAKAIIRLALPMMAAMLAQAIYNMTDLFFIGQTGDPNMVAAVSLVFPIFMLTQAMGNIFATGGSSYISRMLGIKNNKEAANTSAVSFYFSLAAGVLLAVILLCFQTPVLKIIGATENTFNHTADYYFIVSIFTPFAVAGTVFSGLMRSEGATGKAMILQLAGIALNIILDPLFILGFGWGTSGAAWATIAGQLVAFAYGVWYFSSGSSAGAAKKSMLSIALKNNKINKTMLRELFYIGIPAGLANVLMSIASVLGNRVAVSYGDYVVAGFGVQMRIASVCFMFVLGLSMGYQPFAGFNYGARNFERLKKGFKLTLIYSSVICAVGAIVFLFAGDFLIRFFINDQQTVENGAVMLRVFTIGLLFFGIEVTFTTTFQALGRGTAAMLVSMGRQLLFYVPALYILNAFFGFDGFIFVLPVADVLTALLAVLLGIPVIKSLHRPQNA